ncbi:MAG: hypothetical protein GY725_12040 [bacterium]|nr:hypothetical protein [bacterium]
MILTLIRTRLRLAVSALTVFSLACLPGKPPEIPAYYTDEQVEENIVVYLGILFGEHPPTINDYYAAEGPAPGYERDLEIARCARELGTTLESQRIHSAPSCLDWISLRRRNAAMEPSLFYQAVREIAPVQPENLSIEVIAHPREVDGYFRILVHDTTSRRWFEMYHAPRPEMTRISRLGIQRIDSELVVDLLGERLEDDRH